MCMFTKSAKMNPKFPYLKRKILNNHNLKDTWASEEGFLILFILFYNEYLKLVFRLSETQLTNINEAVFKDYLQLINFKNKSGQFKAHLFSLLYCKQLKITDHVLYMFICPTALNFISHHIYVNDKISLSIDILNSRKAV